MRDALDACTRKKLLSHLGTNGARVWIRHRMTRRKHGVTGLGGHQAPSPGRAEWGKARLISVSHLCSIRQLAPTAATPLNLTAGHGRIGILRHFPKRFSLHKDDARSAFRMLAWSLSVPVGLFGLDVINCPKVASRLPQASLWLRCRPGCSHPRRPAQPAGSCGWTRCHLVPPGTNRTGLGKANSHPSARADLCP